MKPFEVAWTEAEVEAQLARVRTYPWPPAPEVPDGWMYGCDGAFLKGLCDHWTSGYDWRAAVADLNRFPQFVAHIEDFDIHFLHVVGEAGGKRPLLISHGWPGSHFEFWGVIEKLAFPSRFGGAASDAFDLVIPSLPGFGFSSKPKRPFGQRQTARLFNTLMTEVLGHRSYLAQGGDWGALVTSCLGLDHAAHVPAIHLNMLGLRAPGGPKTPEETEWATRAAAGMDMLGAYFRLQASKPQSLAWLGAGNPVGQAAWIYEKLWAWTDNKGAPEDVLTQDEMLDNIMLYWLPRNGASSARLYWESFGVFGAVKVDMPAGVSIFPKEIFKASRRWADQAMSHIIHWGELDRGGHFAAWEQPELYVGEVRACFGQVR